MSAHVFAPDELLTKYRALRESVSVEDFFRASGMSRVREMWCAAHFSRAFERHLGRCQVRIDEEDEQSDFDFELNFDGRWHLFQIAEVMVPGRRRGDEYKGFVPGTVTQEDWSPGTEYGAEWIRSVLDAKVMKNYVRAHDINLLLYINFPAYEQNFVRIRDHCATQRNTFKSTWLLNGNALCCLKPASNLPSFEHWLAIPESLVHEEP